MGYFCVDNLPLELVEPLLDQVTGEERVGHHPRRPQSRLRRALPGDPGAAARGAFRARGCSSSTRRRSRSSGGSPRRGGPIRWPGQVSLLEALRRERAMLEEVRARRRRRRRHLRADRARAALLHAEDVRRRPRAAGHGRLGDVVRLQVRDPARRRPALRRPLPGQPALRPRAEGQDGDGPGRGGLHREGPGNRGRSSTG